MTATQRIAVHAIQDRRRRAVPRPWVVRWTVDGKEHSRAFSHRVPADQYRAKLLAAVANGERFAVKSGEPTSWSKVDLSVAAWARTWVEQNWSTWKPNSRRSAVEAVTRFVIEAVDAKAAAQPTSLRSDVTAWLRSGLTKCSEQPEEMPAWVARWTLPVSSLDTARCVLLETELTTGDDGRPLGAKTASRYRIVAKTLLADAVTNGHLASNPWPTKKRRRSATKVKHAVDVRTLPTPADARAALARVVTHQPGSRGIHVLLSLVYFAGLRPSEARGLYVEDLALPEQGWGSARIHRAYTGIGEAWGDEHELEGDTKTSVNRDVPLHPHLVEVLREYIGDRINGPVVRTRKGNPPSLSNMLRSWRRAQGSNPRWSTYDLRHAAATTWLAAGVPIGEVARRLGHSPEVLLSTYAGVLLGDIETSNARIEQALAT